MAFLPTDLSGLAAWWDADDVATVTGLAPVTQWADKSGNGRHLTHETAGPDYIPAAKLMRFDGAVANNATGDTLDLPPMTVRTVIIFAQALNPRTASNRYHAILGQVNNVDTLYIDLPAGNPSVYGVRPKNGLNKVALNGGAWVSQIVPDTTVSLPFTLAGDIILAEYASDRSGFTWFAGASSTRNFRPNVDLSEVLVFERVLTPGEKQAIEGYLAHKWARADLLPEGHPYKAAPPGPAGLAAASASHGHAASAVELTHAMPLTVLGAAHGHEGGSPLLSAGGAGAVLAPAFAAHLHRTGSPVLAAFATAFAILPDTTRHATTGGAAALFMPMAGGAAERTLFVGPETRTLAITAD